MNSDRLAELQRQREAVRQHLAWLDREIASVTGASAPMSGARSPATPPASPESLPVPPLAAYEPDPLAAASTTKRGCLLTAGLLFLLGTLIMGAIFFVRYRDRPLLFGPTEKVERPPAPAPAKTGPAAPRK